MEHLLGFQFVANQLAVDFTNTVIADNGRRIDLIPDFPTLIQWITQAGILEEELRSSILRRFGGRSEQSRSLREARGLRSAIAAVLFQDEQDSEQETGEELKQINRTLKRTEGYRQLAHTPVGFTMTYHSQWKNVSSLLAPIAESAAELLAHVDLRLVKKCEDAECLLHFYDNSKNHSRRWCSMAACGNRNKINAYRRRARVQT